MSAKPKYYVVWEGLQPGIYDNWEDCQEQINHFPGAKFKSFKTKAEAIAAFRGDGEQEAEFIATLAMKNSLGGGGSTFKTGAATSGTHNDALNATSNAPQGAQPAMPVPPSGVVKPRVDYSAIPEINLDAIAVDGACSGNPGMMEYRGVRVRDGEEIFHLGPLAEGTNNVAEYLALVHALALLFRRNDSTTPVYTDSATAVSWLRNRMCRTKLTPTPVNRPIFDLLARANVWVQTHTYRNPVLRWNTFLWGEIPADFDRK